MKYKFKCPKCGNDKLILIESVLTITRIPVVENSKYGFCIGSYGESEQLETLEHMGYECTKCNERWPGLDEVGEAGGFVSVEEEVKDEHQ